MADNSTSTLDLKDLGNTIKGGVLAALREHEEHTQLIKFANENSAPGQKGQQSTPDPMKTISDAISNIAKNQEKIDALMENFSNTRNISQQEKGTSSFAKSLNEQSSKELNFSKVPEAIVNEFSALMRRFGNGPQPSGQSVTNNYQTILNNAGMTPAQQPSVLNVPVPKMDENTVANDQKLLAAEEERQYRNDTKGILKKLEKFLDGYEADGLKSKGGDGDPSSSKHSWATWGLMAAGALGAAFMGAVTGYVGRIGKAISEATADAVKMFKDSNIGKTLSKWKSSVMKTAKAGIKSFNEFTKSIQAKISNIGKSIESTFQNAMKTMSELKSSFNTMLNGWKAKFKESTVGKGLKAIKDAVGGAGKKIANIATGATSNIGKAVSSVKSLGVGGIISKGASALAKTGPVSSVINATKAGWKFGKGLGKRIPEIQAALGSVDMFSNIWKAGEAGGSVTDGRRAALAGTIDTIADIFMIPELMNAAGGAIGAAQSGKSIWKGAKDGFFAERDANDISLGNGAAASIFSLYGKVRRAFGDKNYRDTASDTIAKSYWTGHGYDHAGVKVVSGAAGGFGHSFAIADPSKTGAAGSMQNTNQATASLGDKLPNNDNVLSEDDKMRILADAVKEGVKEAQLSPEVREANAQTARETGSAINGQLFGG